MHGGKRAKLDAPVNAARSVAASGPNGSAWDSSDAASRRPLVGAGMRGRQAWENVESGRYKAGLIILECMAKAMGVRVRELLK